MLPEQRELTNVLQGIQDRARSNGLVLSRFNPTEDIQQDNYNSANGRMQAGLRFST